MFSHLIPDRNEDNPTTFTAMALNVSLSGSFKMLDDLRKLSPELHAKFCDAIAAKCRGEG